jgi:DNA polymerase lambda
MEDLFKGVIAVIISGVAGFTKVSGEIIQKNIEKLGGEAECYKNGNIIRQDATHIIASSNIPRNTFSFDEYQHAYLVNPSWAIDSYQQKVRQSEDRYTFSPRADICNFPLKRLREDSDQDTYSVSKQLIQSESPTIIKLEDTKDLLLTPESKTNKPDHSPSKGSFIKDLRKPSISPSQEEFWESKKHHFQFAQNPREITNHNDHITSVLEELMNNYDLLRDKGRYLAYREAVIRLKSYPTKITDSNQLKGVYKFGQKMLRKIEEILETGTLYRVEAMKQQHYLNSIKQFKEIWGVGSIIADKLFRQGYRTIQDIRENIPSFFNQNQRIGLQYYDEFLQKIPREEVKEISNRVELTARRLAGERSLTSIPCGSYRRGRALCGDVDILMTFEDPNSCEGFLSCLVEELKKEGLVTDSLHVSDRWDNNKKHVSHMFAGVCRLPFSIHRRIDIKIYPRQYYAWALMHFTGSANFNRSIRLFAKKKGYRLSDEGIFPAIRVQGEVLST